MARTAYLITWEPIAGSPAPQNLPCTTPSNADLLEAAFEHAEEIYNREALERYEETE